MFLQFRLSGWHQHGGSGSSIPYHQMLLMQAV
jgi:hypothetical protein